MASVRASQVTQKMSAPGGREQSSLLSRSAKALNVEFQSVLFTVQILC